MATSTVEQVTRLPEFQEQYLANLLTSAQGLFKPTSEGGLGLSMPFAEAKQAGFGAGQTAAIDAAMSGVGAYQPFLQQAQEGLTGAMQTAAGAGMTPTAYQDYMDPFLEDVVQRAQSDIKDGCRRTNLVRRLWVQVRLEDQGRPLRKVNLAEMCWSSRLAQAKDCAVQVLRKHHNWHSRQLISSYNRHNLVEL